MKDSPHDGCILGFELEVGSNVGPREGTPLGS